MKTNILPYSNFSLSKNKTQEKRAKDTLGFILWMENVSVAQVLLLNSDFPWMNN